MVVSCYSRAAFALFSFKSRQSETGPKAVIITHSGATAGTGPEEERPV